MGCKDLLAQSLGSNDLTIAAASVLVPSMVNETSDACGLSSARFPPVDTTSLTTGVPLMRSFSVGNGDVTRAFICAMRLRLLYESVMLVESGGWEASSESSRKFIVKDPDVVMSLTPLSTCQGISTATRHLLPLNNGVAALQVEADSTMVGVRTQGDLGVVIILPTDGVTARAVSSPVFDTS